MSAAVTHQERARRRAVRQQAEIDALPPVTDLSAVWALCRHWDDQANAGAGEMRS